MRYMPDLPFCSASAAILAFIDYYFDIFFADAFTLSFSPIIRYFSLIIIHFSFSFSLHYFIIDARRHAAISPDAA
jgi:hypothetical protein